MKKYLLYALGLVLVVAAALLAFDALCVTLVKQSQGTSMYKMYRLFGNHPEDEIPIFGSSRALANYVPSVISPKAFCYGVDGGAMKETFFQVENYLKLNPLGGPLVINLDPWGFPPAPYRADYTLSTISPEPKHAIVGFRMIGKLREIVAAFLNERLTGTKRIDHGAVLQRISRTQEEWKTINSAIPKWGFGITEEWRSRIDLLCKSSKRPIVWVVAPCTPEWKRVFTGCEDFKAFAAELNAKTNSRVINLYDLDYDESFFMDPTHLNVKGAELFSSAFIKEMGWGK